MSRLAKDAALRARLGAQGRSDVTDYTFSAWAEGFSSAFASLGIAARGAW